MLVGLFPSIAGAECPRDVVQLQAPATLELAEELSRGSEELEWEGRITEAVCWSRRALVIRRQFLPPEDEDLGTAIALFAYHLRLIGEYEESLRLFEELRLHREMNLGRTHEYYANALTFLADTHHEMGSFDRAEPLYIQALEIREREGYVEQSNYGWPLNNLARLYLDMGRYDDAEYLLLEARETWRPVERTSRSDATVGLVTRNLGEVFLITQRWADATMALDEALVLLRSGFGEHHRHVARCLQLLARASKEQAVLDVAETRAREALTALEHSQGPEHSSVAEVLGDLAQILRKQGRYEEAAPLLERAIALSDGTLGPTHPKAAFLLNEMTLVSVAMGRSKWALESQQRYEAVVGAAMERTLVVADEARRLSYASIFVGGSDTTFSMHLQALPHDTSAAQLALTTLLQRKARVQELSTRTYDLLRQSLPPEHQPLLDDITQARARYAALARGGHRMPDHERGVRLRALEREIDGYWRSLAQHSPRVREVASPITIARVQRALPDDAALVEFVRYEAVFDEGSIAERAGDRYAAYLVARDRIDWVDLGPASEIKKAVDAFRRALTLHGEIADVARALHRQITQRVLARVPGVDTLFVSPAGELNRIPFGALVDEDSRYLIERLDIRYLSAGRDLLRPWATDAVGDGPPVVVANPTGAALPGTEREAELLRSLFPDSLVLERDAATEANLLALSRPPRLHLATHGVFAADATSSDKPESSHPRAITRSLAGMPATELHNPMLDIGLMLAEVRPNDSEDAKDGQLTAFEIRGWDLRGTELVTLSACHTGDGALERGEGVLGLGRAFAIAGAQTVVMSLWNVSDNSTATLMTGYYQRLAEGQGRSVAMRNTQLEMLGTEGSRHPYDWAGFVVVGDWTPLASVEGRTHVPPPIEPRSGCCRSQRGRPGTPASELLILLGLAVRRRRLGFPRKSGHRRYAARAAVEPARFGGHPSGVNCGRFLLLLATWIPIFSCGWGVHQTGQVHPVVGRGASRRSIH